MRRRAIAGWSAVGAAVALLGVLAVCETLGWPFLRGPLQRGAERFAGVPVVLHGDFHLRLLHDPLLRVGALRVGAGGGVPVPHLVDARTVELGWRWGDVWRAWRGEPLRIRRLTADSLEANLVRRADGSATWQLGRRQASPRTDAAMDDRPVIDRLDVARARIDLDDAPLQTRLDIRLRGGEGAGAAGYVASVAGRWKALPLVLNLRSGSALPLIGDDGAGADATSALFVEGRAGATTFRFEGRAGALLDARRLDGDLRLAGPSLAPVGQPFGLTLPQTPAFELQGRIAHDAGVWNLRADRAAIGRSRLAGDFRFDTRFSPPHLGGTLRGSSLQLSDLGPSIGARTGGNTDRPPPQQAAAADRVLPNRKLDLPSLSAMNAEVDVAIDELVFATSAIGPLRTVRTAVRLQGGVLELQKLSAAVAGGTVRGSTQLDPTDEAARWSADLRFGGVAVERWLPVLQRREYLSGTLDATVKVAGTGRSTAEILATLDGAASVALRDGRISHLVTEALGVDVAQALGVAVRGDQPLPLRCARLDFGMQRGVMTIRRGVVDNRDSTLRVAGSVDLKTEALGLVMRSRPKDFSLLSLRTPITVSGTFADPQVGVDAKRLGAKAIGALLLGSVVAPVAALLPLLDTGDKDVGDPCADGAPPR